jgi:hypothetical protein
VPLVLPLGVTTGTWLADALVAEIKRRARVPVSQATYTDAELLAMVDEQVREYLAPLMISVAEDYLTANYDVVVTAGVSTYRPPSRCMKLREVAFVKDAGTDNETIIDVPRLRIEQLEHERWGFYFSGNSVVLKDVDPGITLRMTYYLRPNRLVLAENVAVVQSVEVATGVVYVYQMPDGIEGGTAFDIIRAAAPFDTLRQAAAGTVNAGALTVTFAPSALPAGLATGDFVCLPEQTPVPQIAPDLFSLLAQSVTVAVLDEQGDEVAFQRAAARKEQLEASARILLSSRVEGEPISLTPAFDPIWDRSWRRGRGR